MQGLIFVRTKSRMAQGVFSRLFIHIDFSFSPKQGILAAIKSLPLKPLKPLKPFKHLPYPYGISQQF